MKDINGVLKPVQDCYKNENGVWEKVISFNGVDIYMVYVPPGEFLMGSPGTESGRGTDENLHKVRLTRGFWVGKYEVTQRQWEAVMGSNPARFKYGGDYPVEQVSWHDAQSYIRKLNRLTGKTIRLPTEAEWEYACRAGKTTVFHFGDQISSDQANFNGEKPYGGESIGIYRKETMKGGAFKPNAWGIYDMHGNVWEWCSDWYGIDYYKPYTQLDPTGPARGSKRVLRGGSWINRGSYIRSATRTCYEPSLPFEPSTRGGYFGFRLCMAQN